MDRTAIVYHEVKPGVACADGICAAWVSQRKYPDAKLIGASYGGVIPGVTGFDRVLIVDFSFSLEVLRSWEKQGIEVTVIDHHKTAQADLSQFSNAIFDMNESGATLAWKTLFPGESMPAFLAYVRDRDLWNFDLAWSEEIHEAMSFLGRKFYQLDRLAEMPETELIESLAPLGEKLLEPKRRRIAEIAGTAALAKVKGFWVRTVEIDDNESRLTSDVCSYIYKSDRFDPAEFVVAYSWKEKDQLWGLSFRSDKNGNNFDVSEIARQFDGGGHRNAAGGSCKDLEELFIA